MLQKSIPPMPMTPSEIALILISISVYNNKKETANC